MLAPGAANMRTGDDRGVGMTAIDGSVGIDEAVRTRTAFRTCPLCEAGCGLEITVKGEPGAEEIGRIRGDMADVFSHGYLCPKGSTLKHLHDDPDRLRRPLVKRNGEFVEVSWPEAFAAVERGLVPVIERHGRQAVGTYLGNPGAHNLSALLYNRLMLQALGTLNRFSASTVDQAPKQVASGWLFGSPTAVAVPDLDRTDHLLMLGANPYASNGSLCTAPDFPGRLEAIRARGGKVVVVDPRRTKTAEMADEWVGIRPGTDAQLLMAMVHVLYEEGLARPGDHVAAWLDGFDDLRALAVPFTPEAVAPVCGVDAGTIRRLARELAAAPTAAVYGRIGTCVQEFGTLASWLVDALNILTGNLDRPGGAMFPLPAAGGGGRRTTPGGKGFRTGRGHSRVRGLPEVMGEYPAAAMSEEIETPGDGQIRALVTVAGNPVLSTPNSGRLDAALAQLEFMVSVDIYLNETTRHADVILPPPSNLRRGHYDVALLGFAVRNVANYSAPVLAPVEGEPDEWEILCTLALIAQGAGADADPAVLDDMAVQGMVQAAVMDPSSNVHGRDPDALFAALSVRRGPERMLDFMLRTGPYGDGFGADPDGLSLDVLEANPHGVDLGPLQPRLPGVLRTRSARIDLCAPELVADVPRLVATLDRPQGGMVLVGRRDLRSNNSWMHNINVLVKGKARCTLHVHPDDAARLGLTNGAPARVASRVGTLEVPVEVTDSIIPGVVSIPHGWGHDAEGARMAVAAANAGVNSNLLADEAELDPLSGNAVLSGIPVTVVPVA
jgi:anaerobic selenocysteine-containing dehydrogenase